MAASIHSEGQAEDAWLAEINTTPLVDVMLVLLIIFLLTVPVVSASVALRLPTQSAQLQDTSGDYVILSVDAAGQLYLNDAYASDAQQLSSFLEPYAKLNPRPQLQLRADGRLPYSSLSSLIEMAQGHGFSEVYLLTLPSAEVKP